MSTISPTSCLSQTVVIEERAAKERQEGELEVVDEDVAVHLPYTASESEFTLACHGDYHAGHVNVTFEIFAFTGSKSRPGVVHLIPLPAHHQQCQKPRL